MDGKRSRWGRGRHGMRSLRFVNTRNVCDVDRCRGLLQNALIVYADILKNYCQSLR